MGQSYRKEYEYDGPKGKKYKDHDQGMEEDELASLKDDEFDLPGQHENPDEVSTRGPSAKGDDISQGQRLDDANSGS